MSNRLKAIITAILAGLAQVIKAAFDFDIPAVVIDGLTLLLIALAGIFWPSPAEKKS